jgi:outer membrane protein, multidrug efflux system
VVTRTKAGEHAVALNRLVDSGQEVAKLSRLRFEGGDLSYLQVLDAERQLYAAQSQQSQGQRDQFLALISLYKAMGGGWMVEQDKLRAAKLAAKSADDVPISAATQAETKK